MRIIFLITLCFLTIFGTTISAQAQQLGIKNPWATQDARDEGVANALPVKPQQTKQTQQPKPSAIEGLYSARILDELTQFGYDLFGVPTIETQNALSNISQAPSGAVQDDFVLNVGDEVEVLFTGQRTDREVYKINTQGMILISDFPPIPAAGRAIGQVRISIQSTAGNLHNTKAYISLSSVRQIGVLVVGHVKKPGRQNLSVFHTVLDALMASGGIDKTGSLRQIKLVRNGRGTIIDLYGLLVHGSTNMDLRLRDGDRIIIPPLGPTVAISGELKRPGIYEILPAMSGMKHQPKDTAQNLSLNEMLELGGGILTPGKNRFLRLDVSNDGNENVSEVTQAFKPQFGDGAILMVSKGTEKRAGTVELLGHTRRPGIHALDEALTLSALIDSPQVLGPKIYPLLGVIERWDPNQLTNTLIEFPLLLVLKGEYDRKLQDGDLVHLFSRQQIASLKNDSTEEQSPTIPRELGSGDNRNTKGNLTIKDEALKSFLKERSAYVRGAVRTPGAYPIAEGITLDNLLAVSGGLTLEANTNNIELTSALQGEGHQQHGRSGTRRTTINFHEQSPKNISIGAGDAVRVNQKFRKIKENSVLIIGEVLSPGRYDLLPGDKVSDLVARAGGLNDQAYPNGSIFSRKSERVAEESRFKATARDLERSLANTIESGEKTGEDKPDAKQITLARDLASELREVEALGRITVETDPAILSVQPELDMLLESGDRLFVPKRPLTVRVSGEILSPASLQFRSEKDPIEYINQSGGFTYHADKDRTFVLYPDGSAQPLQVSSWNHSATFIPPGSTIVVPRDPKPFDFIESAKDISQILSNLAVTAIFIDDIQDD